MTQVNMLEAKTDLSKLVRLLETRQEEVILIARNGTPVVEMKLAGKQPMSRRIGIAKGRLRVPEDFDTWGRDILEAFEEEL